MSDAGINDIIAGLGNSNLTSVTGVSFAGLGLKLLEANDAKDIVQAINECEDLEYLNLEGNTLGIEAARSIAGALERHKEFKRALWKDMFTGRLKTEIPVALEHLSNALVLSEARLSELDLSDNAFGPIGVEGVVSLLKSPCCYSLQTLKLNNNGLGIGGGKLLASALLDCHKFSQNEGKPLSLKVFIAGRNRLENKGAMALAEFFKAVKTLEQVEMPQNGIYHEAFVALSDAIKLNENLKIINFNDNTVGAKGAEKLSAALSQLQHLNTLNLGDCLLKTKGAKLIAKGITNNRSLEELLLDSNEIKIEAAVDLVEAVLNKQKFKSLSINGNCFGENGVVKIKEMLRKTDKLKTLASLSDDEGDSDSDNESDDVESQDEQDSEVEEVKMSPVKAASIYDFLKCPTADVFMALGNERDNLLLKYGEKVSSNSVDNLIPLILKVASCSQGSDDTKKSTIVNTCDLLLRNLFSMNNQEMPHLNNTLMLHLGLIKSEDKTFKPACNIEGCLYVLGSLINKNYFPVTTKETLKVFLKRDVDNKKEPVDAKSRLLKSL